MTTTTDLRHELLELAAERDALRAQLEGDLPTATRWLQRKAWRQAVELDRLNRRVTRPDGRAAASKAARSGSDSRQGHQKT